MNTDEDKTETVSLSDEIVMSEVDVRPTQISQIDEADTPVSVIYVEAEKVATPMSVSSEIKSDSTAAMMQLLLSKFDEQSVKFDNFDKKLDEQKNEIRDSFDKQFNELKNEIQLGHDNLIKKVDKVIIKWDESLSLLETQKVNSSTQKNAVLNNNVIKNDNSNNELTDSKNITSSKNVVLENDNESIMSENEMFEFIESERKLRESIFVQGVQGVEFSFDVVLGLSLIHI